MSALRTEKQAGSGFTRNSEDEAQRRSGSGDSARDVDVDVDLSSALLDAVPEEIAEAQAHHCAAEVDDAALVYTEWSPHTTLAASVPSPNEQPFPRETPERTPIENESKEQQKHEIERERESGSERERENAEQSDVKPEPLVLVSAFFTLDKGSKHSLHEYLRRLAPFGGARNSLVFFINTPAFLQEILKLRGPSALNAPAAQAEGRTLMKVIENIARSASLMMAPDREDHVSTQSRVRKHEEQQKDSRVLTGFPADLSITRAFHVDERALPSFRLYQKRFSDMLATAAYYPEFENTMVPEYCLAMHAKYDLVALAIAHRRLLLQHASTHIAWIDAGYFAGVGGLKGRSTTSTFALRALPFLDASRVAYTEVRPLGSWRAHAHRREDSSKRISFTEGLQRSSRKTRPLVRAFAYASNSNSSQSHTKRL